MFQNHNNGIRKPAQFILYSKTEISLTAVNRTSTWSHLISYYQIINKNSIAYVFIYASFTQSNKKNDRHIELKYWCSHRWFTQSASQPNPLHNKSNETPAAVWQDLTTYIQRNLYEIDRSVLLESRIKLTWIHVWTRQPQYMEHYCCCPHKPELNYYLQTAQKLHLPRYLQHTSADCYYTKAGALLPAADRGWLVSTMRT